MNLSRALAGFLASSKPQKWALLRHAASLRSAPFSTEYDAPAKRGYNRMPKPPAPAPAPEKLRSLSEMPAPPKKKSTVMKAKLDRPPMKDRSELPRPSEIPFQARVSNSVHLAGTIGVPIQLETSPDGVYSAVSILVREKKKEFPHFWIPVIFQGDLAQIAACHLHEDDLVYVTGQLCGDGPPFTIKDAQANIQILAHNLCFVGKDCPDKEDHMVNEQDKMASDHSGICTEKNGADTVHIPHDDDIFQASTEDLWNDLLSNPHKWWDNRTSMRNKTSAAFKHKASGQLLWINDSTPECVLSKLDKLFFGQRTPTTSPKIGNVNDPENHTECLWNDLVVNPPQWWDNRMDKLNGSVNRNYPDFRNKVTQKSLWLDSAPDWVLPKLDNLKSKSNDITKQGVDHNVTLIKENGKGECSVSKNSFKVKEGKTAALSKDSKRKNNDDLWKDLLENSNRWWDNRTGKLNPKAPDFKHKDTGEGLWLDSSTPSWVLPKLPASTAEKKIEGHKKKIEGHKKKIEGHKKQDDLWKDLVENPKRWWDNRTGKLSPKSPDFKHKDTGEGLWLGSSTPSWVLPKLPPSTAGQRIEGHKKATLLS